MFNENINTQEQEIVFPEKLFENSEPEINDIAENAEEENGEAVSEKQNVNEEEKADPAENTEEIANARSRALAQVERINLEKGLSGPWGNLFLTYPSLSRNDAYAQLDNDVKSGMTPLEAYQRKLLEEKDRELSAMRSTVMATKRSVGTVTEENTEQELDAFLQGFYSV